MYNHKHSETMTECKANSIKVTRIKPIEKDQQTKRTRSIPEKGATAYQRILNDKEETHKIVQFLNVHCEVTDKKHRETQSVSKKKQE